MRSRNGLTLAAAAAIAWIPLQAKAAEIQAEDPSLALATGAGACDTTTDAVAKACAKQTATDCLLALGACANIEAAGARERCNREAVRDLRTGQQDCEAQTQARAQVCGLLGQAPYDPAIRPSDFSANITNRYFPLQPGTVFRYRSPNAVVTVTVLRQTVRIDGVTCRVVRDTKLVGGKVSEDTLDYYSQDRQGNVWYFGEATAEFENGVSVSTAGSFVAGVDSAKPGIIMLANPTPGRAYRQEFKLADAEDIARVVSLGQSVTVPFGTFHNALKTLELNSLEPGANENKYYVPAVGNVLTVDLDTGEREVLVSARH